MVTMWEMGKAEMEQNFIIISKMGQINKQPMKAGVVQELEGIESKL